MIGSPHLRRAQVLMGQDRYAEAEKEIGQAMSQQPDDPFALAMLSECYIETERRSEALELAQRALSLAPQFAYFYHNLARAQFFNKKVDEWLPYFESKKEIIELKIGSELTWNPNPNNKDKVITLTKHFELENKENWKEAIKWLAESSIKFKETFAKIIKEKTA